VITLDSFHCKIKQNYLCPSFPEIKPPINSFCFKIFLHEHLLCPSLSQNKAPLQLIVIIFFLPFYFFFKNLSMQNLLCVPFSFPELSPPPVYCYYFFCQLLLFVYLFVFVIKYFSMFGLILIVAFQKSFPFVFLLNC
jgi:hypothetical protein